MLMTQKTQQPHWQHWMRVKTRQVPPEEESITRWTQREEACWRTDSGSQASSTPSSVSFCLSNWSIRRLLCEPVSWPDDLVFPNLYQGCYRHTRTGALNGLMSWRCSHPLGHTLAPKGRHPRSPNSQTSVWEGLNIQHGNDQEQPPYLTNKLFHPLHGMVGLQKGGHAHEPLVFLRCSIIIIALTLLHALQGNHGDSRGQKSGARGNEQYFLPWKKYSENS